MIGFSEVPVVDDEALRVNVQNSGAHSAIEFEIFHFRLVKIIQHFDVVVVLIVRIDDISDADKFFGVRLNIKVLLGNHILVVANDVHVQVVHRMIGVDVETSYKLRSARHYYKRTKKFKKLKRENAVKGRILSDARSHFFPYHRP